MAGEAQQGRTPDQREASQSEVTGFPLSRETKKTKSKMDSGLRRNDGRETFAGMTK
jgi:hypothetical protein